MCSRKEDVGFTEEKKTGQLLEEKEGGRESRLRIGPSDHHRENLRKRSLYRGVKKNVRERERKRRPARLDDARRRTNSRTENKNEVSQFVELLARRTSSSPRSRPRIDEVITIIDDNRASSECRRENMCITASCRRAFITLR